MARRTNEDEAPEPVVEPDNVANVPAASSAATPSAVAAEDAYTGDEPDTTGYPEADNDGLLKVDVCSNLTLDGVGFVAFGTEAEVPNTPQVQDAILAGHLKLRD